MVKNNVDKELQEKVRGYLEHLAEEEKSKRQYRGQFLAMMPETFKKDILMNLNGYLLTENIIFSFNFNHKVLREAASILVESTFCPGELICSVIIHSSLRKFIICRRKEMQLDQKILSS